MESLIHCIYASTTTCDFGQQQLAALLRKARDANGRSDVTGMLLYVEGSFFQVLEGQDPVIDELFAKITLDKRHESVTRIIREPIAKRTFGEWTMVYAAATRQELHGIAGLNDFFANASCYAQLDSGRAKKLLAAFGKGRWRKRVAGAAQASAART